MCNCYYSTHTTTIVIQHHFPGTCGKLSHHQLHNAIHASRTHTEKSIKNEMITLSNSAKSHMNNKSCHRQITNNQRTYQEEIARQILVLLKFRLKRLHCPVFISRCASAMKLCRKRWTGYKSSPGLEARAGLLKRGYLNSSSLRVIMLQSELCCSLLLASSMSLLSSYCCH